MGSNEIYLRMLRNRVKKMIAKLLSNIYQCSWSAGEVPEDWGLAAVISMYEKGCKDPGNYRPVSLTLVPRKIMKQIVLSEITQYVQAQPAQVRERQVLLDQTHLLL